MKQKTIFYFFSVMLLLLFSSCVSLKFPTVSGLSNLRLTNATKDMRIQFDVGLNNPNNYGITLRSMKLEVLLEDSIISAVGLDRRQRIAAKRSVELPFSVQPRLASMPKLGWLGISQLFKNDDKHFAIQGELVISKFIFRKKYKFRFPKN